MRPAPGDETVTIRSDLKCIIDGEVIWEESQTEIVCARDDALDYSAFVAYQIGDKYQADVRPRGNRGSYYITDGETRGWVKIVRGPAEKDYDKQRQP